MATVPAEPGQVIDVCPEGTALADCTTGKLLRTDGLEVIRLVLPAGKELPTHSAPGEMTVHCLAGQVAFTASDHMVPLHPGQLLSLTAGQPHAVRAVEDALLLVTIVRGGK